MKKSESEASRREESPRVARRRRELIEAAKAVIERVGTSFSMDDIAREAHIARPALYRYFGDRSGLTQALAVDFADVLSVELEPHVNNLSRISPSELEGIAREVIDRFFSVVEKNPRLYSFLLNRAVFEDEKTREPLITFLEIMGKTLALAVGELIESEGGDSGAAEPVAYSLIGTIAFAAEWWVRRAVVSRRRMVEYVSRLVLDGLRGVLETKGQDVPQELKRAKLWN